MHFRKRYNIICFVDAKDVENGIVQEKNAPLAQLVEHLTLNQGVQGSSPWRRTKELFLGTRSLGDGSFFVEKNRCKTSVLHQFQHGDGRFKEDDIIVHGCVMAIFAPVVR